MIYTNFLFLRRKNNFVFLGLVFFYCHQTYSQPSFTDVTAAAFPSIIGLQKGDLSWGDMDNDGDLDLLISGSTNSNFRGVRTFIYENTGTTFNLHTNSEIHGMYNCSIDWGDYDLDGDLDFIRSGVVINGDRKLLEVWEYEATLNRYLLSENFEFNKIAGDVDFGDFDRDGDLDILLAGKFEGGMILFENGLPSFSYSDVQNVNDVYDGAVAWADYNLDGKLDFFYTGVDGSTLISYLCRNQSENAFNQLGAAFYSFVGLGNKPSVEWGDWNQDGKPDLLTTGNDESGEAKAILYTNSISSFTSTNLNVGVSLGDGAWGDMDNDGDLDIVITGLDNNNKPITEILLLNENYEITETNLEGLYNSSLSLGDYDSDGDLDIITMGIDSNDIPTMRLYQNNIVSSNSQQNKNEKPQAPNLIIANNINDSTVNLSWGAIPELDSETENAGLTFNFYIKNACTDKFVVPPMASIITGKRYVVEIGNAGQNFNQQISNLEEGIYVWSVQAIDNHFAASPFAPEQIFIIGEDPMNAFLSLRDTDSIHSKGGSNAEVSLQIKIYDQIDSIVDSVKIYYKGISETVWNQEIVDGQNGNYSYAFSDFSVPEVEKEIGFSYFYKVFYAERNVSYSDTAYAYLEFPEGISFSELTFGDQPKDYQIISVPLDVNKKDVQAVFSEFGEYDTTLWRVFRHNPISKGYEEYKYSFSSMEKGKGYWLIATNQTNVNTGALDALRVNEKQPYELTLKTGWNLIGNPYPFNLSLEDILTYNGNPSIVEEQLCIYQGGQGSKLYGYSYNDVLPTFKGAYLFTEEDITLKIPVIKNPSINRKSPYVTEQLPILGNQWQVNLILKSGEYISRLAAVGMRQDASLSKDRYDAIMPPRFQEYLELNFEHPEYFSPKFSRDIVPTASSHIWDFEITTNKIEPYITLSWENKSFGRNDRQLYLYDLIHQKSINMREHREYSFRKAEEKNHFQIYYGDDAFIKESLLPRQLYLGEAYPNPALNEIHIPFAIPKRSEYESLSIHLYDIHGRLIKRNSLDSISTGFHQVQWDIGALPRGVYVYSLWKNGRVFNSRKIMVQ